jgi:hypothetical protein
MNEMLDISKLINTLHKCKDTSKDGLLIKSKILENSIETLKKFNISFDEENEGIRIDLSVQDIKIYKNKNDCIKYFKEGEEKDILIIEDEIYYQNTDGIQDVFFENLIYSLKIKNLIKDKIASHDNEYLKSFFFLSSKKPTIDVSYKNKALSFYSYEYDLKNIFYKLEIKCKEDEYLSFFRDNFIHKAEEVINSDDRFLNTLKVINIIFEKSNREFELYKSKFSLEEFQSKLDEEKNKYFKKLDDTLSEFLTKVNSLPIQFGVYTYLIFRFEKEIIPLSIIVLLISVWSVFSYYSMQNLKLGLNHLHKRFVVTFSKIYEKEIFDKKILKIDKKTVKDRVKNIYKLICYYQLVSIVLTIGFIGIFMYLIISIAPNDNIQIIENFINYRYVH